MIARVHRGPVPLVHADAYRLGDRPDPRAEIDDLDLDASAEDAVTVVEWGAGLVERLNDEYLQVRIDRLDDDTRVIELRAARRRLGRPDWTTGDHVNLPDLLPAEWRAELAPFLDADGHRGAGRVRGRGVRGAHRLSPDRGPVRGVPAVPAGARPGC